MSRILPTCTLIFLILKVGVAQAQYPFIRHNLNKIDLPHDSSSWFSLAKRIKTAKAGGGLRILHFGDSHIQGDYFTGQVRKHLFSYLEEKNCSRGITMPYRALTTNGPDELLAQKTGEFEITSVRKNMPQIFALSGYCISAIGANSTITMEDTSTYRFNKITVVHGPLNISTLSVNGIVATSTEPLTDSLYVSTFLLPEYQNKLRLQLYNASILNKLRIYAFLLENDKSNVTYSSIGVNGATFGTFLNLYGTTEILKYLKPDCIVFSYGTNDALLRLDTANLKTQVISCISKVKAAIPEIPIIFTTPGDHLIHNKKSLNPRVAFASKLIRETAVNNNCGAWDFFNIMGGTGSVKDWYSNQLVFSDGIHLSKKGYRYQGDLFFAAFIKLKDLKNSN